jgi:16S rRNA (cytosine1402-N4)-methyltransferase
MSQQGLSAMDVVNTYSEKQLADIIYHLGEEHASRRIARSIVALRPMQTTTDLAQAVYKVLPKHGGQKLDPATKTFQAIRIYVNNELEELERALTAAEEILLPEGRLVVVSFHGLEDKIVKNFLRERAGMKEGVSRYRPQVQAGKAPTFVLQDKKSLQPSASELQTNPRSRSARLRWAIRTAQDARQGMEA